MLGSKCASGTRPRAAVVMPRPRLAWLLVVLLGVLAPLGGCEPENEQPAAAKSVLRIGVLPDQQHDVLQKRYEPIRAFLERTIGVPCELVLADSYEAFLKQFTEQEIDLAYFGAFTFVAARERAGAIPLVLRHEDRHFVSYCFVAGSNDEVTTLHDLEGARLGFGSRLSTSGHLMPRYFLTEEEIDPESYFSEVQYTGSHDQTAYAVRDGHVDVGYANAQIIDQMLADGRLVEGDIRIVCETPPYVDYVWAASPTVPEAQRQRIQDAFLALDPGDADHAVVLTSLGASAYFPAAPSEFDPIASVVEVVGLLDEGDR